MGLYYRIPSADGEHGRGETPLPAALSSICTLVTQERWNVSLSLTPPLFFGFFFVGPYVYSPGIGRKKYMRTKKKVRYTGKMGMRWL
jgi:hypothetical protein